MAVRVFKKNGPVVFNLKISHQSLLRNDLWATLCDYGPSGPLLVLRGPTTGTDEGRMNPSCVRRSMYAEAKKNNNNVSSD